MKSTLHLLAFAGAFALAAASPGLAQTIPVQNYLYNTQPDSGYPDGGGELTDGVASFITFGTGISLTLNDVQPLVGWASGYPDITFDFAQPVTIRSFTVWAADSDGVAGVSLPSSVTFSAPATSFSRVFTVNEPQGNGATVPLTFGGFSVTTNQVRIVASAVTQWTMFSEVTFSSTPIPEPSSAAALAGAFAAGCAVLRRRRSRA